MLVCYSVVGKENAHVGQVASQSVLPLSYSVSAKCSSRNRRGFRDNIDVLNVKCVWAGEDSQGEGEVGGVERVVFQKI